ncbi:carboxylating nicotinate-nucleotide diphosphorylase [Porticoccus sp. W117]|uniref:carboxylating nicotinate-nucleotide diphosphorylase n=1 Tax=Porticoccus sp. W117 TaxID=3054777 RepID=UPI0025930D49|nr:carboxylating nicotinate-nucleotide diphosphorylase [Porticoccus sp. W117]MDM3871065.1 carboxylating nicotinate-nucleotide diphosphorylase [Porticoccus sp. W117]
MSITPQLADDIRLCVERALTEDIGSGDITAMLIPSERQASARVITREAATFCGRAWVDEVYRQLDPQVEIDWLVEDGQRVEPDQTLFTLSGSARSLLTGERAALNFLQTLCGTATAASEFAHLIGDRPIKILDTRKTLPGLRLAQKYAVKVGGCHNHRIGLYDAFLIKENHIAACGGIAQAVSQARQIAADKPVEVEVENLDELQQAIDAGADIVMLDNFSKEMVTKAVEMADRRVKLEVSGNITAEDLAEAASAGIDFISSGALTKHCRAVDLSFRLKN